MDFRSMRNFWHGKLAALPTLFSATVLNVVATACCGTDGEMLMHRLRIHNPSAVGRLNSHVQKVNV